MAENQFQLHAESRNEFGTNASRRLRAQGKIPAIVYGAGKDNSNVLLDHNKLLHALDIEAFHSAIIDVQTTSGTEQVILRDVQMHPYKLQVLHIDFQRVSMTEKLHMNVPLHILGEDSAPGIKIDGGLLSRLANEVDIECLPKDLPEYLELDVSELGLGETLHLSDIKLPEGVEIVALASGVEDADQGVVTITQARVTDEITEEGEEAPAEGEAPSEDEGGAE